MADMIKVVCPECEKAIQAPAAFVGKKVRCKGCGHVFAARAAAAPTAKAGARPAQSNGTPAAAPTKASKPNLPIDDDDGDGKPYQVTTLDLTPRCPECANELEEEGAIICLHCGYNTQTRERAVMRKVHDTTPGDVFMWLLPGVACIVGVVLLIACDIVYCLKIEDWSRNQWFEFMSSGAIKFWVCLISVFGMWLAGKFAFKRLILNPKPPEIDKH